MRAWCIFNVTSEVDIRNLKSISIFPNGMLHKLHEKVSRRVFHLWVMFCSITSTVMLILHRDAEKTGGNLPGSSAMPSNEIKQPVADSPGNAKAIKSKDKKKADKKEKEKKEKQRKEKDNKEKERKEKEKKEKEKKEKEKKENKKKDKEKKEKEKKEKENKEKENKEKEKKEKEKKEKEKKEKDKREKEQRKKKAKAKAEKPADPPRATVFGRTVKQPEDKGGKGKAIQSNDAKKPTSKR